MSAVAHPGFALAVYRDAAKFHPSLSDSGIDNDHGDGGAPDDPRWVTVATFWTAETAYIARLHLESRGVRCLLLDENLIATDWLLAQAVGGIKLQVPRSLLTQARAILGEHPGILPLEVPPDRADRLAVWIAVRLHRVSHATLAWLTRRGRHWWVGALLPAALATPFQLPPRWTASAIFPAASTTAPAVGAAAA